MKRKLSGVTLLGIDCLNIERLIQAAEICLKNFDFEEIKLLTSLESDNAPRSTGKNIVKISPINSTAEYSEFVLTQLDKYVETPHVLIIQYDGFILNPQAWKDEFLKYDYVGAPWKVADWSVKNFDFPKELVGQFVVGNGGFNLRSKKLISICAKLIKEGKITRLHPEDVAISVYYRRLLEDNGIVFAPVELAKQFSYEAEDEQNNAWNGQFGFHGLRWTNISKWLEKNKEYNIDNTLDKDKRKISTK